jgi:N-acetylglucosaminyldiphosphoundecaprenol N-acetyl-beta-D-mannosaminyltransferase
MTVQRTRRQVASAETTSTRARVLDVPTFVGSLDAATEEIRRTVMDGAGGYACFCNVHVMVMAQRDRAVMRALQESWMVFPDGAPIAWLLRRHGHTTAQRVCGPDVMMRLLVDASARDGMRHYLLGSSPSVLWTLLRELDRPGVQIVGHMAPPVASVDALDGEISLEAIARTRPDVVWCALGAPKQELWMCQHAGALGPALVLGVGAAFEFLAGTQPRAPLWMQSRGLEWAHRAVNEPRRLGPRYLSTNSRFLGYVARDALRRREHAG